MCCWLLYAVYAKRRPIMEWLHLCILNFCWSGMNRKLQISCHTEKLHCFSCFWSHHFCVLPTFTFYNWLNISFINREPIEWHLSQKDVWQFLNCLQYSIDVFHYLVAPILHNRSYMKQEEYFGIITWTYHKYLIMFFPR